MRLSSDQGDPGYREWLRLQQRGTNCYQRRGSLMRVLYWHPTGPKISYGKTGIGVPHDGTLYVSDLNPDVETAWAMSRWDMLKLGLQCLRVAIKPPE